MENIVKNEKVNTKEENYDSCLLSLVVPTYKEAKNINPLVTAIDKVISAYDYYYEIIVVDDDSKDGTFEIVEDLIKKSYPVKLITRVGDRGLSSAVIKGFRVARGKFFICMDADLSHPPEAIPRLIAPLLNESNIDLVLGSRYVPGASTNKDWGILRWLNSKIATIMARPFVSVKDPMSGFFALPREVFNKAVRLNPIGYKIGLEIMVKCECKKVLEIPIHFSNRQFGVSKLNFREQLNYLKHLKRLADFKFGEFSRFFQFAFVGTTGLVVDISAFVILLKMMPLMAARGVAIWIAMTWNFWTNRRLTFSYGRKGKLAEQYIRFVLSCGLGAMFSWSISVSLASQIVMFMTHPIIAAIIGVVVGTATNYLLSRFWVFKK